MTNYQSNLMFTKLPINKHSHTLQDKDFTQSLHNS